MRAPCKPEEFFCVMIAPSSSPSSKPAASGASIPSNYLKDVLTQIPLYTNKTVAQLTRENWLKHRQSRAARAA